eukprot:1197546-Rhodomonas_salina.5
MTSSWMWRFRRRYLAQRENTYTKTELQYEIWVCGLRAMDRAVSAAASVPGRAQAVSGHVTCTRGPAGPRHRGARVTCRSPTPYVSTGHCEPHA